jgi:hypothetical protein
MWVSMVVQMLLLYVQIFDLPIEHSSEALLTS